MKLGKQCGNTPSHRPKLWILEGCCMKGTFPRPPFDAIRDSAQVQQKSGFSPHAAGPFGTPIRAQRRRLRSRAKFRPRVESRHFCESRAAIFQHRRRVIRFGKIETALARVKAMAARKLWTRDCAARWNSCRPAFRFTQAPREASPTRLRAGGEDGIRTHDTGLAV